MKVIIKILLILISVFSLAIFSFNVISGQSKNNAGNDGESYKTITDDGAWCWFADPRAVYYEGKYKRTYIGWVNKAGDIIIAYYDHNTKKIATYILKEKLEGDDHANPSIFIRNDGRFMVFYSAHCGPQMYYRISKNPEDISLWNEEMKLGTNVKGTNGYTYSNTFQLSKEDNMIYFFWRGGDFKPNFSKSKDGIVWEPARTMIKGTGYIPYIKYESDGVEKIHFAFTDDHPRFEEKNNIYYMCYQKGAFYRADGTKIKNIEEVPINPSEADRIYDAYFSDAQAWIWDIAIDNKGYPVIVYAVLPELNDHRYRYARWNGKNWNDYELTSSGSGWFPQTPAGQQEREPHYSGGVILDHTNPSIVYLSKKTDGIFEIEKWVTTDGGHKWTSEKITSGSKKNNVRPFVPRNHKQKDIEVIWMYGDYFHWTVYHTALKAK